ncbi:MOSC domain-containing protein [Pradoshia sp. D12]|uniref:MOSC domain-containing protein n=1 Tax=Bacillus sp. E214 TaxID=2587156 RepID=UPI0009816FAF|nr:MOSC domain-containing protein [Bacillus sp. E214]QFK73207.1 MOSC domain-containing protein [Pradoshia sp. D12]TPF73746.1 MOSC domain-containing protein [Bacillus sp. D12]
MREGISLISGTIESIRVGKPASLHYKSKIVQSAIYKDEVHHPIHVSKTNLEGDKQSDLNHHGGPDKAICVYPSEHYPYWSEKIGQLFKAGDFGENLTIFGLTEDKVRIGDILKADGCLFQVTQPREPCYKIAARHNIDQLPFWIRASGYSGYYLRVLEEGILTKGSVIEIIDRAPQSITIAYANQIMHHDSSNREAIQSILSVDALSESWKEKFSRVLASAK